MTTHQHSSGAHQREHDADAMRACIEICQSCHATCLATLQHCLQMGGAHADRAHIGALLDCAQACATSADFMLRGSDLHARTCAVCAEACQRCAESCRALDNDPQMHACLTACERCAESCRQMASA